MGACLSTGGMGDVSDDDRLRHQQVEKQLKEVSPPPLSTLTRATQSLLGQGEDGHPGQGNLTPQQSAIKVAVNSLSGPFTRIRRLGQVHRPQGMRSRLFAPIYLTYCHHQQMRLIHKIPFSPEEIECYRQLVFNNLITGMTYLFDAMDDMGLEVAEECLPYMDIVRNARDLRDHEPFPNAYYEPLRYLWEDKGVQKAYQRGNEVALPEKHVPFYDAIARLHY